MARGQGDPKGSGRPAGLGRWREESEGRTRLGGWVADRVGEGVSGFGEWVEGWVERGKGGALEDIPALTPADLVR